MWYCRAVIALRHKIIGMSFRLTGVQIPVVAADHTARYCLWLGAEQILCVLHVAEPFGQVMVLFALGFALVRSPCAAHPGHARGGCARAGGGGCGRGAGARSDGGAGHALAEPAAGQ